MSELAITSKRTRAENEAIRDELVLMIWTLASGLTGEINKRLGKIVISGIGKNREDLLSQSIINHGHLITQTKEALTGITKQSDFADLVCKIEEFPSEGFTMITNKVKSISNTLLQPNSRQSVEAMFDFVKDDVARTLALMYFIHFCESSAFDFAKYACANLAIKIEKFDYFNNNRPNKSLENDFLYAAIDEFMSNPDMSVIDVRQDIIHLYQLANDALRETFLLKKFSEARNEIEALHIPQSTTQSISTAAAV